MSEKMPYVPGNFTEEDWQLIANALRKNPDERSQELAVQLQNWRIEIEFLSAKLERAKLAYRVR